MLRNSPLGSVNVSSVADWPDEWSMYIRQSSVAETWRLFGGRTQNRKLGSGPSFTQWASGFGSIVKTCRESRTSFLRSIEPSSSSTAVFGTRMIVAGDLSPQRHELSFGLRSGRVRLNAIHASPMPYEQRAGR